jgi:hypothetical protein
MLGDRLMRVNKYGFGEEDTDVSGVRYCCGWLVRLVYSEKWEAKSSSETAEAGALYECDPGGG